MNEFVVVLVFLALCGSFALFITWMFFSGVNAWWIGLTAFVVFQMLLFAALKTIYPPSDKEKRHD